MPANLPTTLTSAECERFERDGYVVVQGAFSPDAAAAMEAEAWAELAEVHGIVRDDRTTWRPVMGDLKRPKLSPLEATFVTTRVRGVIDDLLGAGRWAMPRDWGRALVTFPEPGAWDVPIGLWHWDSAPVWHRDRLNALFVVSFVGRVAPRGGGTLILAGSPRLLARHQAKLATAERGDKPALQRDRFFHSHPWLMALTGQAPSRPASVAAFMDVEADLDGLPARVVELTGQPGDTVFCHPDMVHCVAPNRGDWPRFMRIKQQLLTTEGQALLKRARY